MPSKFPGWLFTGGAWQVFALGIAIIGWVRGLLQKWALPLDVQAVWVGAGLLAWQAGRCLLQMRQFVGELDRVCVWGQEFAEGAWKESGWQVRNWITYWLFVWTRDESLVSFIKSLWESGGQQKFVSKFEILSVKSSYFDKPEKDLEPTLSWKVK